MAMIRRLVLIAVCAGVCAGLLATGLHQIMTVPLILAAEEFEVAAPQDGASSHGHEGGHVWQPHGVERLAATGAADVLTGIAFALILVATWTWCDTKIEAHHGVLWGLAGFIAVSLAPSLGLPPVLPGSAVADLPSRQIWWIMTVLLTSAGLSGLAFVPSLGAKVGALAAMLLPHMIGAPEPAMASSLVPLALSQKFHAAALGSSLGFWIALGAISGYLMAKRRE